MPSASFRTAPCSLQRQGWSGKSRGLAIKPKLKQRAKLLRLRAGSIGLGQRPVYTRKDMPIWSFLHARRQPFPSFPELAEALEVVWPWGEAATIQEVVERLGERWSPAEKEAAVWKLCADAAACGHLLVDLANVQLSRLAPLICLPPDSPPILPDPLPSHLESSAHQEDSHPLDASVPEENDGKPDLLCTFDDSLLDEKQRERFLRNLRAVEAVENGATLREAAAAAGMGRSTLGRLLQRTGEFGQLACVPRATYHREREVHPAFQQTIRLLIQPPDQTVDPGHRLHMSN